MRASWHEKDEDEPRGAGAERGTQQRKAEQMRHAYAQIAKLREVLREDGQPAEPEQQRKQHGAAGKGQRACAQRMSPAGNFEQTVQERGR